MEDKENFAIKAAQEGDLELVIKLIANNPTLLEQTDENNQTPLLWAASKGHADVVSYLIGKGANLNANTYSARQKEFDGLTPLGWAVKNHHYAVVAALVKAGATSTSTLITLPSIIIAATDGDLEFIRILLENNSDLLDQADIHCQTPLLWAASKGHTAVVSYLVGKGASLNASTNDGTKDGEFNGITALGWALEHYHYDVVAVLVKAGATSISTLTKLPSIIMAAREGDLEFIRILLENNPDLLDQADESAQTSLLWAASKGHTDVVSYLIGKGANLNVTTNAPEKENFHGLTPLGWAVKDHHYDVIAVLVKAGVTSTSTLTRLPSIVIAARDGDLKFVTILLENNPDLLEQADKSGQTGLLWAASKGHTDVVSYLIGKGANLNVTTNAPEKENFHGLTPLDWAVKEQHYNTASRLYAKGVPTRNPLSNDDLLEIISCIVPSESSKVRKAARIIGQGQRDPQCNLAILPTEIAALIASYVINASILSPNEAFIIACDSLEKPGILKTKLQSSVSNTNEFISTVLNKGQRRMLSVLLEHTPAKKVKPLVDHLLKDYVKDRIPLHAPEQDDALEMISVLLEYGADCTILNDAISQGLTDRVKILLKHITDINKIQPSSYNLLVSATEIGSLEIVELLFQCRINPNSQNQNSVTALIPAIIYGHDQIVHKLLNSGADISIPLQQNINSYNQYTLNVGDTALDVAIKIGKIEMAIILLLKVSPTAATSLLRNALATKHLETAKFLLKQGIINVNARGKDGETALLIAVEEKLEDFVDLLLEFNPNCNLPLETDSVYHNSQGVVQGDTPLHVAVRRNDKSIISKLIRGGADRLIENSQKETPQNIASNRSIADDTPNDRSDISRVSLTFPGTMREQVSNFFLRRHIDEKTQNQESTTPNYKRGL